MHRQDFTLLLKETLLAAIAMRSPAELSDVTVVEQGNDLVVVFETTGMMFVVTAWPARATVSEGDAS